MLFLSPLGVWVCMNYQFEIGSNKDIPLLDDLCRELKFAIGDILFCEQLDDTTAIVLSEHIDQSLTDAEIESLGILTLVIPHVSEVVKME